MANIRRLKKDVNFITNEIVIECFTLDYLFQEKHSDQLAKIISDALKFNRDTIKAINSVDKKSDISVKKQFKEIRLNLEKIVKDLVERLEQIA